MVVTLDLFIHISDTGLHVLIIRVLLIGIENLIAGVLNTHRVCNYVNISHLNLWQRKFPTEKMWFNIIGRVCRFSPETAE